MLKSQKHFLYIFISFLIYTLPLKTDAELTVHIQHPWVNDSSRLANGLYVQSSSAGWYPGTPMSREAGNWFTYTFAEEDSGTNDRFDFVSFIPTQHQKYDGALKYSGGTSQLIFKNILTSQPTATELWILVDDISGPPRISFTPPKSKVVNFFNPWSLGAPRVILQNSNGSIKTRGIQGLCGWFSYFHFDTTISPVLRFINSLDSSLYGALGTNDTSYVDFSGLFANTDTLWLLPTPYPNGPPIIHPKYPGKVGDCTPITIAAKIWDIGEHIDFGGEVTGDVQGMVQQRLGQNGKPVVSENDTTTKSLDTWFQTQTFPGGHTNEQCHNIELKKNSDGLYEYMTSEFFPIDDFKFLGGDTTLPNPNYGLPDNGWATHNYHFTMEIRCEFEYVKGQKFYFRGDDDVWVFIDSQLVVDIGGIHGPIARAVDLDTLGLTPGKTYGFKLFFAERHCCGSNFKIITSINLRTDSKLFHIESIKQDSSRQYDMYEKITQSNLSCDAADDADTAKAVVDFYITGPYFDTAQQLFSGTSYGGLTISEDYTQLIINEKAIVELPIGNYVIHYYSTRNPAESNPIAFTVTSLPKPIRNENRIVHASVFADNGLGKASRLEVFYQDTLDKVPDSLIISWPSLLQRKSFSGPDIQSDPADNRHITVQLNDAFPGEATTFLGTDNLGISYSTDTSFANPHSIIPFKIADSIGPLITSASYYERTTAGPDTFFLTFSETIIDSTIIGNSLLLVTADTIISLNAISIELTGNTLKILTAGIDYSIQESDSLRFNPLGPARDAYQNYAHQRNRPVKITIIEKPPRITDAFYSDVNADGTIDQVTVLFDKQATLPGISAVFSINASTTSIINGPMVTFADSNHSKISFDLSNTFSSTMDGVTSGTMSFKITNDAYPGTTQSGLVRDSAAPVLMDAYFSQGIPLNETDNAPDTLIVSLSERVQQISSNKPFLFLKPFESEDTYSLTLHEIDQQRTKFTFIVSAIEGSGYPSSQDSVYIDPLSSIADITQNTQKNPFNRRVLLRTQPIKVTFRLTVGPSPFNPVVQNLTVKIDPTTRTKNKINIKVEIVIFDPLGNCVFDTTAHSNVLITCTWDGTNHKGRLVGTGTYLLFATMTDLNENQTEIRKIKIGVIKE